MIAWSLKVDAKLLQAGAKLGGAVQNKKTLTWTIPMGILPGLNGVLG